ncbi:Uncharacterised protein [uncultured Clostridium sp.]|nr:Uncharacterised protein [uncultured Clostridium sp.]SCJ50722.1 Uncharacterised protein [uncultured Clostridium sp.]
MNRRHLILFLIFIILGLIIFSISKNKENEIKTNEDTKYSKNIEPISKETALKVLKSQYGNRVVNTKEDIKQVGDEYVVDVRVRLDEHEDESLEKDNHVHEQSIGKHQINIFTGELTKSN